MLDRLERLKKENHYLKGFLQANNLLGEWHTKLKEQGREPVDISSIDIEVWKRGLCAFIEKYIFILH